MDVAHRLTTWYQTASPKKLAELVNIDVRYKELPNNVYGLYIPQGSDATVILNSQLAELRQKFVLCYDICKHLTTRKNNIIVAPKQAKEYDVCPASCAFDLLIENGDIEANTWSLIGSFIDAGTPPHIVFGVYDAVAKAKSQYRPLTNV